MEFNCGYTVPSVDYCGGLLSSSSQEASSDFSRFGIRVSDVSVDISSMQNYKDKIVSGLTQGIEGLFKRNKVDYLKVINAVS